MQLAKVIGLTTATIKHDSLAAQRMLLVQLLDANDQNEGDPLVAMDQLGCRRGDRVMLTSDGRSVREMLDAEDAPVRWAVIGIVNN
ncbi:MAG: EutN/CcmL family microcompartment protein [Planctomycetaceae bacterium]